jgi:plasmid replication initiation protein
MPKPKKQEVVKSNALVEAAYRLSVSEQRIILACIAQVRRDMPLTDEIMYSVKVEDIARLSGSRSKSLYEEIERAAGQLFDRRVAFYEAPNGLGKPRVRHTRWVQTVDYCTDEGRVDLRFSKDMVPYLSQLTVQFTRYALSDVARMTSSHAIRLYELLAQWQSQGVREIPLPWLQEVLGLKGRYPTFKDFRRRVVEPAVKQINSLSPLVVTWQPIKTGRKVTALQFEFKRKGKAKQVSLRSSGEITRQEVERLAKPGESYEAAAQRILRERLRKPRPDKPARLAKPKPQSAASKA